MVASIPPRATESSVSPSVTVKVPAKINLHLAAGARRPDGYHELVTVFHAVSLYDEVAVSPSTSPGLEVYGEDVSAVPSDSTNLAWRAVDLLARTTGHDPNVRVVLRKGIPVAGGMAGGSADAAGTLVALSTLWKLDLSRDELSSMAAALGSDVTFALHGGTALGTGRGERIVPLQCPWPTHWVIAPAHGGLSTPTVFAELDRLRGPEEPRDRPVEPVLSALALGDRRLLARSLGNDLQAAAVSLAPGLRRTLHTGVAAGAVTGIVSGSGPTCAFLCVDTDSADAVAAELVAAGVCRMARVAHGPVPGAAIVGAAVPTDPSAACSTGTGAAP